MNIITKEYLSLVKMNLQGRNNLSMRSTVKDLILVYIYPLGICDFLFRNNSNDNKKMHFIQTRKIFDTPKGIISPMNNFFSAGLIQRFW